MDRLFAELTCQLWHDLAVQRGLRESNQHYKVSPGWPRVQAMHIIMQLLSGGKATHL